VDEPSGETSVRRILYLAYNGAGDLRQMRVV
jgi:hypothetical protein